MSEPIKTSRSPQRVQAQGTANERVQFQGLKSSLDTIASWELAGASWDEGLVMKFSQNFSDDTARLFLKIIS